MNLFDLYATISLDTSEYKKGVKDVSQDGSGLVPKLKSSFSAAGKAAAKGLGIITGAATAVTGGLIALEKSTEEYRIAQGKLNTAFEAAGYSADTANQAYTEFYKILGDTDTATEASQLLAKLAENEKDVATWTNIAAGVSGTFGDSLPIEGLIEASNETAKVGQVTGVLADALNWAGISEDAFNAQLASCTTESERNQLIMETLSGTYDEASEAFYRNNEALIESRKNQAQLDATLAILGQTVSDVKNSLLSEFLPAISEVTSAFSDLVKGAYGSDEAFSQSIGNLIAVFLEKLPEFLGFGVQIITAILNGIIQCVPSVVSAIPQVVGQIVTAFLQLIPQFGYMGIQVLQTLTDGIESGLPDMLARLPQIVTTFLNYITENLPFILEKGTQILNSLVNGIINAIPQLVAALPQIIISFTGFLKANLPQIIQAGFDILLNLIQGIINAIPELAAMIPDIIAALVEGLDNLKDTIIDAGKKIVDRIIDGIWEAWQGLVDWFSGLWDSLFGNRNVNVKVNASASGVNGSHASGLSYVPFDGYIAELHRGEMVLNRTQAATLRQGNVSFARSGLGVASAGIVNGLSNPGGAAVDRVTVNLVLPDGTKLASYLLPSLVNVSKANGTPILRPV